MGKCFDIKLSLDPLVEQYIRGFALKELVSTV